MSIKLSNQVIDYQIFKLTWCGRLDSFVSDLCSERFSASQTKRNDGREFCPSINNPKDHNLQSTPIWRNFLLAKLVAWWCWSHANNLFCWKDKNNFSRTSPATGSSSKSFAFRHAVFLRTENSPGTSRDKSKSTDEDGAWVWGKKPWSDWH